VRSGSLVGVIVGLWRVSRCGEDQRMGPRQKDKAEEEIEVEVRVRIWVRESFGVAKV
jgi:hypothetical protein